MKTFMAAGIGVALIAAVTGRPGRAQQAPADGPRYASATELARPTDYREWIFVTSGLGMTYGPAANAQPTPRFDNVFVNPSSYRSFMQTGKWPEKTVFVLEIRSSDSEASINKAGRFQTNLSALEVEVKDTERFPDGWAYFNFGGGDGLKDSVAPLPKTATCYECHSTNTAVEHTFVQFYPTLLDVARRMGTIKPTY